MERDSRIFCQTLPKPGEAVRPFNLALVNCCVTESGLEEQLFDIVIANEHHDLHEQKIELVKETSDNTRRLQTIQTSLLKLLSESTSYITDNNKLLVTLEETKSQVSDIAVKLETAARMTVQLDKLDNEFIPVAKRGSVLFFSMNNLSAISSMHQVGSYTPRDGTWNCIESGSHTSSGSTWHPLGISRGA